MGSAGNAAYLDSFHGALASGASRGAMPLRGR